MAFDQAPPTVQPDNYFHWPMHSEPPKAISPTAEALKGTTEAVTQGSHELNEFGKEYAGDKATQFAEKTSAQYGSITEDAYQKAFPGQLPDPVYGNKDTLTPNASGYAEATVPQVLKDRLSSLQSTKDARDQGGLPGHIREVQYHADILKGASELRARFPGYRDYIDSKIERVTGFTPNANAYYRTMLSDLNELYNKKNEAANKLDGKLAEYNHIPGVADLRTAIAGGQFTLDQGWHKLSELTAWKGQADLSKAQSEIRTNENQFEVQRGTVAMNNYIPGAVDIAIQSAARKIFPTPESIDSATPDHWRAFKQALDMAKIQVNKNVDDYFGGYWSNTDGSISPGVKSSMGEKYDTTKKPLMAQFDAWEKVITDKDTGFAHELHNGTEALKDRDVFSALKGNEETNNWYRSMFVLKELAGPGFQFGESTVPGYTPPGPRGSKGKSELDAIFGSATGGVNLGGISSMKDALGLVKREADKGTVVNPKPLLDNTTATIKSSSVDNNKKANLVKYTFGPDAHGWMDLIKDDQLIDPITGQQAQGKHAVFWQMAHPDMVKGVKDMHDPKAWDQYSSWMDRTFSKDIVGPDLKYLSTLQYNQGLQLILHQDPTGTKPMKFEALPKREVGNPDEAYYGDPKYPRNQVKYTIFKLNTALEALHNVEGANANGKFMSMLRDAEVNTTTTDLSKPQSALQQLILSVGAAGGPKLDSKKDQNKVGPQLPTGSTDNSGVKGLSDFGRRFWNEAEFQTRAAAQNYNKLNINIPPIKSRLGENTEEAEAARNTAARRLQKFVRTPPGNIPYRPSVN